MSGDTEYCYPPSFTVLKNKLNIRDASTLGEVERRFVVARMRSGIPDGDFDLAHLKVIHHHLFQDVYDFAGKLRTVEISKDGHQFQFRRFIETGMADVHRRLVARDFLRHLKVSEFARHAGEIMGDINYVHPFREGNGRTQLAYLKRLSEEAGHVMNLRKIDKGLWLEASRQAHLGKYDQMAACIGATIAPDDML